MMNNTCVNTIKSKANIEQDQQIKEIEHLIKIYKNNGYWAGKQTYNPLFSEEVKKIDIPFIMDLLKIRNVTINKLHEIIHQAYDTLDPDLFLSNIKKNPCLFLNDKYQLISLNMVINFITKYNLKNNKDVLAGLPVAFIYNEFTSEQRKYYIKKYSKINKNKQHNLYNEIEALNINLKPTGSGWYLYDKLEYKYKKFKSDCNHKGWDIIEWDLESIGLISIKDENRVSKEKLPCKYWAVPKGEYWTMQPFRDLEMNLTDKILEFCERYNDDLYDKELINSKIILYEKKTSIKLNEKQKDAIHMYFTTPIMNITGLPGSGKTTVTATIIWLLREIYIDADDTSDIDPIVLAAPTGKAVKNLTNKIEKDKKTTSQTLHRLLYYIGPYFNKYIKNTHILYDEIEKAEAENLSEPQKLAKYYTETHVSPFKYIIVDEASMIDLEMFNKLIDFAIEFSSTIILFIGDNNQLPPIQAGRPFKDLCIAAEETDDVGKIIFLDEIKRTQGKLTSVIKKLSNKEPLDSLDFDTTTFIKKSGKMTNPEDLSRNLLNIYAQFDLDIKTNCAILTPQNGDKWSNYNRDKQSNYNGSKNHINEILQEPNNICIKDSYKKFYNKSLIMRIHNSYKNGIFKCNGDIGELILRKNDKSITITVIYDDGSEEDILEKDLLHDFDLRYGMTVHKKQGDEEDNIIIIVSRYHRGSWETETSWNLVYTAISRAKKRCIILGDIEYFLKILKKTKPSTDYSELLVVES